MLPEPSRCHSAWRLARLTTWSAKSGSTEPSVLPSRCAAILTPLEQATSSGDTRQSLAARARRERRVPLPPWRPSLSEGANSGAARWSKSAGVDSRTPIMKSEHETLSLVEEPGLSWHRSKRAWILGALSISRDLVVEAHG